MQPFVPSVCKRATQLRAFLLPGRWCWHSSRLTPSIDLLLPSLGVPCATTVECTSLQLNSRETIGAHSDECEVRIHRIVSSTVRRRTQQTRLARIVNHIKYRSRCVRRYCKRRYLICCRRCSFADVGAPRISTAAASTTQLLFRLRQI